MSREDRLKKIFASTQEEEEEEEEEGNYSLFGDPHSDDDDDVGYSFQFFQKTDSNQKKFDITDKKFDSLFDSDDDNEWEKYLKWYDNIDKNVKYIYSQNNIYNKNMFLNYYEKYMGQNINQVGITTAYPQQIKPPPGLVNITNSCFVNSAIQLLYRMWDVTYFITQPNILSQYSKYISRIKKGKYNIGISLYGYLQLLRYMRKNHDKQYVKAEDIIFTLDDIIDDACEDKYNHFINGEKDKYGANPEYRTIMKDERYKLLVEQAKNIFNNATQSDKDDFVKVYTSPEYFALQNFDKYKDINLNNKSLRDLSTDFNGGNRDNIINNMKNVIGKLTNKQKIGISDNFSDEEKPEGFYDNKCKQWSFYDINSHRKQIGFESCSRHEDSGEFLQNLLDLYNFNCAYETQPLNISNDTVCTANKTLKKCFPKNDPRLSIKYTQTQITHDIPAYITQDNTKISGKAEITNEYKYHIIAKNLTTWPDYGYKKAKGKITLAQGNGFIYIQNTIYNLVAMVCHSGEGTDGGHYIAYVKYEDKWYKYNDSQVEKINFDFNNVNNFYETLRKHDKTLTPTIMLYERDSEDNSEDKWINPQYVPSKLHDYIIDC